MDGWFCRIAGREIGPLSLEQLQTMAASGQLVPNDRVRQGEAGSWIPADDVEGLFSGSKALPSGALSDDGSILSPPVARILPAATPMPEPAAVPEAGGKVAAAIVQVKRKRRRQTLLRRVTTVVIAGLGIVALIWAVAEYKKEGAPGGGFGALAKNAEVPPESEPVGKVASSVSKGRRAGAPVAASTAENLIEPPSGKSAHQTEPAAKEDESKWVDASMSPAVFDKIRVSLVSVAWQGPERGKREGYRLAITVEVQNAGVASPVTFAGWSPEAEHHGVLLVDQARKVYPPMPADPETTVENMLPIKINPGKSAKDVLLFDAPDAKVKYLRLQLSASVFKRDEIAYFQIPASMIGGNPPVAAPPSPPKPAKKPPLKPQTPKKAEQGPTGDPKLDFGISPDEAPPM